jgi:hypothetical protein
MELNITELDEYNNQSYSLEEIPENIVPTKVIKKSVHFGENVKPIPKINARRVRPAVIPPKPKISYDDILANMGMFVNNGKLLLADNQTQKYIVQQQNMAQQQNVLQQQNVSQQQNVPQNSYIYNKYFKDELKPVDANRPLTKQEYINLLLQEIAQQKMAKQRQSNYRKLVLPNSNINVADARPRLSNQLFNFSQK